MCCLANLPCPHPHQDVPETSQPPGTTHRTGLAQSIESVDIQMGGYDPHGQQLDIGETWGNCSVWGYLKPFLDPT